MRALNVFLIIIFTILNNAESTELETYFLVPSDKGKPGSITHMFRSRTTILYDSNPCHDRVASYHLSTPAHTVPGGNIKYEPFPGARFDGVLMNSLSFGLWDGLQIGFIPTYYMLDADKDPTQDYFKHSSNLQIKWTLFSFKNLDIALAWSSLSFQGHYNPPLALPGGNISDVDLNIFWTTLILNYYFEQFPMALGINLTSVGLSSNNKEFDKELQELNTNSEYLIDLTYRLNSTWSVAAGFGKIKETAFELQKAYYGYGASITYTRNKRWFNQITIGAHHFNDINRDKFLFSFSI